MESLDRWLKLFGLNDFRPGQRDVIEAILGGRDTLCIMPTGGGKSLCYQLPAVAREGVTLVVSPLIALMKDQVDTLVNQGIAATCINSSMTPSEQSERISRMVSGDYKLIYIAPERLRHAGFLKALSRVTVKLLAVDEAHCISQWGHDFRPDYARLGRFRERIGNPQTVALTATATSTVREDIQHVLALKDPALFVSGFARTNLSLRVESPKSNSEKDQRVIEFLKSQPGNGIIYTSSRKSCEHLVELLSGQLRFPLEYYHAGMTHTDRHRVQENFMSGKTPIVVATNAFGMGIDKSDLRFVLHYNIPGSLEAYYQEAGRAGRDGKMSVCLLLNSYQDRFIQEFFIENSYPSRDTVQQVYEYFQTFEANPIEITLQELKDQLGLSIGTEGIANCEHLLEKAGAIERLDAQQNMAGIRIDSQLPTLVELLPKEAKNSRKVMRALEKLVGSLRGERVMFSPRRLADSMDLKWEAVARAIRQLTALPFIDYVPPFRGRAVHVKDREKSFKDINIDFAELERRKKAEYLRLEKMIAFATSHRCRQLEILNYFGDPDGANCQNCDRCGAPWPNLTHSGPVPAIASLPPVSTKEPKEADPALLYVTQVALSGVLRTKGRVGKSLVVKMLQGSEAKNVKSQGLQKLSTFGLLRPLKGDEIDSLMSALIQAGFIIQTETAKFRPTVSLSATGHAMMKGQLEVKLENLLGLPLSKRIKELFSGKQPRLGAPLPDRETATGTSANLPEVMKPLESIADLPRQEREHRVICEQTRSAEQVLSDQQENDGTEAVARVQDRIEIRSESFGPAGMVGDDPHARSGIDEPLLRTDSRVDQAEGGPKASYYWTWRLFRDGYTVDQVRQIRNLSQESVVQELREAAKNRLVVETDWLDP